MCLLTTEYTEGWVARRQTGTNLDARIGHSQPTCQPHTFSMLFVPNDSLSTGISADESSTAANIGPSASKKWTLSIDPSCVWPVMSSTMLLCFNQHSL